MKEKISLSALVLFLISALTFYVFAQSPNGGQDGPYVVGNGLQPPARGMVLLQSKIGENGNVEYVQIIAPNPPNSPTFRNGIIRIEMLDGSVQEIPLLKVKRITIE